MRVKMYNLILKIVDVFKNGIEVQEETVWNLLAGILVLVSLVGFIYGMVAYSESWINEGWHVKYYTPNGPIWSRD